MTIELLRQYSRQIWEAALLRANPSSCIPQAICVKAGALHTGGKKYSLDGRVFVIGAGKAGARMADVIEEMLGDRIAGGLVVTKYGHRLPLRRIELREAGHPIPDEAGSRAVEDLRQFVSGLNPNDLVLCLISGGGSALWPAPAEGITLQQKQEVTSLLLRAGAGVRELNAVRKHMSAIKGGQLARWVWPAQMVSLIMSDVVGDPLDFIASGPTAPDTTSFSNAMGILRKYGIPVPAPVLERFRKGERGEISDTPKPGDPVFDSVENLIVANNRLLIQAARQKAEELKFNTLVLGTEIEGEAKDVGLMFAAVAREIGVSGNPIRGPACVLGAGETTVTVRGKGLGGRNQEMALAWAHAMELRGPAVPCCFASVATDGTDGPTDAAGGLVDPSTCTRAAGLGLNASEFLQANDSWTFLKATGDLIVTGPTQTNLMDLQILLTG
jgi:glycerate 2-kinase